MMLHVYLVTQVLANLGAADIDSRLEEQLIDGILFAFQEQTNEVHKGLINKGGAEVEMKFQIIYTNMYMHASQSLAVE